MLSSPVTWTFLGAVLSAAAAIAAAVAGWRTLVEQDKQVTTLQAWVTGGDSYAYFVPLRRGGRLAYFIRHGGNYPAYDVYLRVQDGDGNLLPGGGPISFGTLRAGAGVEWLTVPPLIFPDPPVSGTQAQTFRLEIATRNGVFVQRIQLRVQDGRWHTDSVDIQGPGGHITTQPFPEAQQQ